MKMQELSPWIDAVAAADLTPTARHVALTLVRWTDDRLECFPAVATISRLTGRSRRAVQLGLAQLRASGLLEVVRRGGGRALSTLYRLRPDAGKQRNACAVSQPETAQSRARNSAKPRTGNSATSAPEPSIHLNQFREPPERVRTRRESARPARSDRPEGISSQGRWMDGRSLQRPRTSPPAPPAASFRLSEADRAPETRNAAEANDGPLAARSELSRCGVSGPMLDRLVGAGVTLGQVREAWGSIARDGKVRDRAAVLVRRLAPASGIRLDRPASIDPALARAARLIESRRRDLARSRCGELVEAVA
jgi:DNA-binding transcriptional ArsR family regulator